MTACTCPTCGHEVPPMVDWTHYERDVSELAELWLTSQEAALAAIRAGRTPAPDLALGKAQGYLIGRYFPSTSAFLMPMLGQGRIDVRAARAASRVAGVADPSQRGTYTTIWTAEGVVWPAHAARPGGAA